MPELIFGDINTHCTSESIQHNCCKLNDTQFIVTCVQTSNYQIRGTVYERDGLTLTEIYSAELGLSTETNRQTDICKVSDNLFAITSSSSSIARVSLFGWSGSAFVNYGIQYTGNDVADMVRVDQIEDNKIILVYKRTYPAQTARIYALCLTCNDGISLYAGTRYTPILVASCSYPDVKLISPGKIMIAYRTNYSVYGIFGIIGTIPSGIGSGGRVITFGSIYQLTSGNDSDCINISCQGDDKAIIVYNDITNNKGSAIACTINGTIITNGSSYNFNGDGQVELPVICRFLDEDNFVIAYSKITASGIGTALLCNVNWITYGLTFGSKLTFESGAVGGGITDYGLDILALNDVLFAINYQDDSDGDKGKIILGGLYLSAPTNVSIVEGFEQNTISWDSISGADTYNIYWEIDCYINEYFNNDLSNWSIYKLQGGEYVEIVSNKLKTELYDSISIGWDIIHDAAPPVDEFIVEVDLDTYTPSDNNNGHYIYFYVVDSYGGDADYAYIRYHVSGAGTTHNIRTNLVLDGSDNIADTTISGTPTKFRIERDGNTIEIYYYISTWVLVDSLDFGARASLLDYVQLSGIPNSGNGGITEFDNVLYWPDLKETGTKISGVTSPYNHTSLTKDQNYYYVVTAENLANESDASEQVVGVPFGLPSPPTGISVAGSSGQNIITFTTDPEATITNIYWDTSPIVTTGDNKISDVSSSYIHSSLDPSLMYYYILTSENVYGEGDPSSEYNDSPYPVTPTSVGASSGVEKNIIVWTGSLGADAYNIYWRTLPGVTKVNGTKISDVTSPYTHLGLTAFQTIYYVVTSEDEDGESNISSEVSATPYPPIAEGEEAIPQPPAYQYSILSTFSENTKDNLSKLFYPLVGTPTISGYNKVAGNLYNLYEELDFNSCLSDNSFDIEEVNSTSIKVTTGRCVIGGVCIDIKEDKILNVGDDDSYFSWVNVITGAGTIYVLIYYDYDYDAEVSDKRAYIGLMQKIDYGMLTTEERKYYCLLGAIKVNSSVEIISPLYYWDPDDTSQDRPYPNRFADGGWLDLPDEFIY